MNTKKIILGFCTALAFFLGQIFLESALSAASAPEKTFAEFLVPVFSLAAGWAIGYFFAKTGSESTIANLEDSVSTITEENSMLKQQIAVATSSSTKKRSTVVKQEKPSKVS